MAMSRSLSIMDQVHLQWYHTVMQTAYIILILQFKDITQSALNLFECINVGDLFNTERRLISDLNKECFGKEYY